MEKPALLDSKVRLASLDSLVGLEIKVEQVSLDHRDNKVIEELLEPQGQRVELEQRGSLELLAPKVQVALSAKLDFLVLLVLLECRDHVVTLEHLETVDSKEVLGLLEQLDQVVLLVRLVSLDRQDLRVPLA